MEIVVLIWIVCGIAAAVIASGRGESGCLWFGLGFLLGPLALIAAFTLGEPCPNCRRKISSQASACPHCGRNLAQPTTPTSGIVLREDFEKCPQCQCLIDRSVSNQYCQECGAPLEKKTASKTKTCPYCAEQILAAAIKCRYCGEKV